MALNPNPNAVRFLETLSIPTGRKAMLGDANTFKDDNVRRILNTVHQDVSASLDVVSKLEKDESRTPVARHHRAKQEADKLNNVLADARDQLRAIANDTEAAATSRINSRMTLEPARAVFQSLKIAFLSKTWAEPNGGSAAITKHVKTDLELASLLVNGESYILGIPDDARSKFIDTGIKTHMPGEYADMQTAARIRETAEKYGDAMNGVRSSFYIEAVADRISSRVE